MCIHLFKIVTLILTCADRDLLHNQVNIFTAMTHTKIIPTRPEIFSHKNWVF